MSNRLNPENVLTYMALKPATDAAGRTSLYFSLKHAKKATFKMVVTQGHATPPALSFEQATAVAGTSTKGCDTAHRIWASNDVAVTKDPTSQTAAAGFTPDAALKDKLVIIEIDPMELDVANGFDCIAITTGASNVANLTCCILEIETKYPQTTPATATAD
ncbi:MAG: hypothetical protein IT353_19250 [Gemmatimonadaceae bacterium]|nr:hypothetical protein [Gemmatimonadaceae bacterium]